MRITLTLPLAYAAGMDAANRRMRAAGRTAWNLADHAVACRTIARLWDFRRHCPKGTP